MGPRSLSGALLLLRSCRLLLGTSLEEGLGLDDALAGCGSDRRLQQGPGNPLMWHDAITAGQDRLRQPQEPHGYELRRPELAATAADQGRAHDGQGREADPSKRVLYLAFDPVVEEARARIGSRGRIQR